MAIRFPSGKHADPPRLPKPGLSSAGGAQESSEDVPEGALLGDVGEAPSDEREALVSKRLGIWWRQDRRFYYGTITAYDAASGGELAADETGQHAVSDHAAGICAYA